VEENDGIHDQHGIILAWLLIKPPVTLCRKKLLETCYFDICKSAAYVENIGMHRMAFSAIYLAWDGCHWQSAHCPDFRLTQRRAVRYGLFGAPRGAPVMGDEATQRENPELSGQSFLTKIVLSERILSYGFVHSTGQEGDVYWSHAERPRGGHEACHGRRVM